MRLLDTTSNEVIDLTNAENPDAVIPGIFSGHVTPDLDSSYKIKLPGGQVADVTGGELDSYLKQGATFYTKADAQKAADEEHFGSVPQQLAAGALGVGRGLTLGLSDQALTKTGLISPEYLQKQEEYNPEAGVAGEVAGAVLPAVLSGGESLAAKALQYTPAGLVGAAGKAVSAASAPLAEMAGSKVVSPIAQKAIAKATELGLGSAAEGALYGGGKAVSESAIQNKPLTAEALLSDMGTGALVGGLTGGVLGGGIEAGGELAKKGFSKLDSLLSGKRDKIETALIVKDLAGTKANMKNILQNDFKSENIRDTYKYLLGDSEALSGKADILDDFASNKGKEIGLNSLGKGTEELRDKATALKELTGKKLEEALKNSEMKVNQKEVEGVMSNAKKQIDFLDQSDKRKAQAFIDTYKSKYDKVVVDEIEKNIPNKKFGQLFRQISDNDDAITSLSEKLRDVPELLETNALTLQKRDDVLFADLTRKLEEAKKYQKETMNHALLLDTSTEAGKEADKVAMAKFNRANQYLKEVQKDFDKLQKNLGGKDYGPELANNPEFLQIKDEIASLTDKNGKLHEAISKEPEFFKEIKRTPRIEKQDLSLEQLWRDRQFLDGKIFRDGFKEPPNSPYVNFLRDIRTDLEGKIEAKLSEASPEILSQYKQAKRIYSGASDVSKLLDNKLGMSANNFFSLTDTLTGGAAAIGGTILGGPVGGLVGTAAGAVGRKAVREYGDRAVLMMLSQLEKKSSAFNKVLDDSVHGLLSAAGKGANVSSIAAGKVTNKEESHEEKIKQLDKQIQRIEEIKDGLNRGLGAIGAAAPETAMQLRDKALNAIDFLNSKAPKRPEANPLVKYQVPESEIDKFNRYVVAVEKPKTILQNLKGGYISPEEIEVLKNVYPEMHAQLKAKAIDALTKKGQDINYQLRLQLQKLLETKSDVNLYPTSVKTLQQTFQPTSQVNQQPQTSQMPARMPGSRAKSLNLGSKMSSGLESTIRRRNS